VDDPVAVRASGLAAEGDDEQFERAFLSLEGNAVNAPMDLILAERYREDCGRCGNCIGGPERSEAGLSVDVEIQVQMLHCGDALFGAVEAAKAKPTIGSNVDVGSG